jgi:hypothetical protein
MFDDDKSADTATTPNVLTLAHLAAITAYVDTVEAGWRETGVPTRDRRRLAADLQAGLEAALGAGADLGDVLSADPQSLALEIAAAEGLQVTTPPRRKAEVNLRGLIKWGFGSAIAAAAFVWFVALLPVTAAFYNDSSERAELVSVVVIYAMCTVLVLCGTALGLARYLRDVPGRRLTVLTTTICMGLGGGAGVAVCVALARLTNYSDAPAVILTYVVVVGAFSSAGASLAWRLRPLAARSVQAD